MPKRFNVLAIVKQSGERYIFFWEPANLGRLIEQFRKFADDPELSFSRKDFEELSERVKQLA